jgi:hypothetical protein
MKKRCRCWNCLPTNCSKGGKHVSTKVSKNHKLSRNHHSLYGPKPQEGNDVSWTKISKQGWKWQGPNYLKM